MSKHIFQLKPARGRTPLIALIGLVAGTSALLLAGGLLISAPAYAAQAKVGLGTAAAYSVLGGASVTNTGATTLQGNLGVSPGTLITGFPPGIVGGVTHAADAPALQAQSDLATAYNDAAGRAMTANVGSTLGGKTLVSGVYTASSSAGLTGTLTLDAKGDPTAVFIFQIGSTLTTASSSSVSMINGAQPCNVFWQIGSSATLGTNSDFVGTILAHTSISVTTGVTVQGRALARIGSVTLDTDVFTAPACLRTIPTGTTSTTAATTVTNTNGGPGPGTGTGTSTDVGGGPGGSTTPRNAGRGTPTNAAAIVVATGPGTTGPATTANGRPNGVPLSTSLASTGLSPLFVPSLVLAPILLVGGGLLLTFGRRRTANLH
jgi:Ice-binding-like